MPTDPIGAGTCNVPVNMPMDARLVLGRLAFAQNISTGELIRRQIAQALPRVDRKSAKELRRLVSALVVLVAGLVVWASSSTQRPTR